MTYVRVELKVNGEVWLDFAGSADDDGMNLARGVMWDIPTDRAIINKTTELQKSGVSAIDVTLTATIASQPYVYIAAGTGMFDSVISAVVKSGRERIVEDALR